jgi:hypothetical protein
MLKHVVHIVATGLEKLNGSISDFYYFQVMNALSS